MKDVVKVSISGISFVFDAEAYAVMKGYIDKLEKGYASNPDGREIVADIEARIAELLLSGQDADKVIHEDTASGIVAQLGFPDDIDTGPEIPVETIPKRLYRNPEGAVIGGVCSGLGTYFRVDPVWIRIGFFAPLLLTMIGWIPGIGGLSGFMGSLFGMFVMLYFILWIAIPMARTPRQKLEMRGEKITASSIKQNFHEEAQAMSPSPKRERSASAWADFMYGLGKVLQVLLKIFVIFFVVIFGIVAVSLLVALVAIIFGGAAAFTYDSALILGDLSGTTPEAYVIMLILLVILPVIAMGYLLIRAAFGTRTNKPFLTILGVIWLLVLIYFAALTVRNIDNIRNGFEDMKESTTGPRQRIEHESEDWNENEWREEWRSYDDAIPQDTVTPGSSETDESAADGNTSAGEWREEERSPGISQEQGGRCRRFVTQFFGLSPGHYEYSDIVDMIKASDSAKRVNVNIQAPV